MAAPKVAIGPLGWSRKAHPDYRTATLKISVTNQPEIDARLIMLAHISMVPRKYDFTLLLGSECVLRLDVNPGSTHFDPVALVSVAGTHWQPWPCHQAQLDDREFNHLGWLNEFLNRALITWDNDYREPPFEAGEQIGMDDV